MKAFVYQGPGKKALEQRPKRFTPYGAESPRAREAFAAAADVAISFY